MRHRDKVKKLGRTAAHRKATLRNIARAMIEHHQIKTTLAKAKAARSYIERLVTYGKKDTVAARRLAFKFLQNHKLVKKLFDEIAPTFAERNGGYTRIIKLGRRRGDGAELAVLQFVGFEPLIIEEKKEKKKPAKKKAKKEEAAPKAAAPAEEKKEETPVEAEKEVKEETKEEAAETPEEKTETKEKQDPEEKKTKTEEKAAKTKGKAKEKKAETTAEKEEKEKASGDEAEKKE